MNRLTRPDPTGTAAGALPPHAHIRQGALALLPPTDGAGGHIVCKGLCPLSRYQGGGVTHRGGDVGKLASIVAVADPHGLTVGEVGSGREAHRVGCG